MNRLDELFSRKQQEVLNIYFTAGFPQQGDTLRIAQALQAAGVDMIEIGVPFSDPVADGPTIQQSNQDALDNGMTLRLLFEQLQDLRPGVQVPVLLMGYINTVMAYGVERFCQDCQRVGIDGVIFPDLPLQEYKDQYQAVFQAHGLHNIFLITPQTSQERIRLMDQESGGQGFLYMVSQAGTTGAKAGISLDQEAYFARVEEMQLQTPRLIGFGISDRASFARACQHAQGAIIGSAFVNLLRQSQDLEADIASFVAGIRG